MDQPMPSCRAAPAPAGGNGAGIPNPPPAPPGRTGEGVQGHAAGFVLCLLLAFDVFLAFTVFAEPADPALAAFLRDFRVWCLRANPDAGGVEWFYPLVILAESLLLGGIVLAVWGPQARPLLIRPQRLLPHIVLSLMLVSGGAYGSLLLFKVPAGALEFPGEAIRTSIPAPDFALVDQHGHPVRDEDIRGRVTVLTAFYAHCVHTCPAVFAQARRVVNRLDPALRDRLTVLAVTMEPDRDLPQVLREAAAAHGLEAPLFRLATGPAEGVDRLLDRMGVQRERDPETGVIAHNNLFLLVDSGGRIAYRFTLGDLQEEWMLHGLRHLLEELPAEGRRAAASAGAGR